VALAQLATAETADTKEACEDLGVANLFKAALALLQAFVEWTFLTEIPTILAVAM